MPPPPQAIRAGKAAHDKAKKLKRGDSEVSPPPQALVVAAKAEFDGARKARNKAQE